MNLIIFSKRDLEKYLHIFDKITSKGIDIKHKFKFILMDINISNIQKIKQNESESNLMYMYLTNRKIRGLRCQIL